MNNQPGSAMFRGHLVHVRRGALANRFRYPVCFLGIDLGDIARATDECRLLSRNRPNVYSLYDGDYGAGTDTDLRSAILAFLADGGCQSAVQRIHLVTQPRIFGYVFNPVSFFLCYDADDLLTAVVAEVNNHFGGRHRYLLDDRTRVADARAPTFVTDKALFVSPFIHGDAEYAFEFRSTGDTHDVRMRVGRSGDKPFFTAQLTGERLPLTDRTLARLLVDYPLMTAQVTGLIHWQAFRLWRMGGEYRRPYGYVPSPVVEAARRLASPLMSRLRRGYDTGGTTTSSGA